MGEQVTSDSDIRIPLRDRLTRHTIPFIAALWGCGTNDAQETPLTFQLFDDDNSRRDPGKAKVLYGTLRSLQEELERRNREEAGVFVCINATDKKGRSKANIVSLQAWWADLDDHSTQGEFDPEVLPLLPTLIVDNGHGYHPYWRATEPIACAGDEARKRLHEADLKAIQRNLVSLGADPMVCEVARVLRLPGFYNMKREPHQLVELLKVSPVAYSAEEIRIAFPTQQQKAPGRASTGTIRDRWNADPHFRARAYAEVLAREAPAVSGAQGHKTTLQAAIKIACGFDLTEEEAFAVLKESYNARCQPPWAEVDLRRKVKEALRVCSERGWMLDSMKKNNAPLGKGQVREYLQAEGSYNADTLPLSEEVHLDIVDPTRPCFRPFRLDQNGLWFLPKGKTDEDGIEAQVRPTRLSGPFEILAETRDMHASSWGLRVRWNDRDGVSHEETIPKVLALGEGSELARILIRHGLWVAPDEGHRKKLVSYFASVSVPGRARSVERVGWHGSAFVLPDRTYGEAKAGEQVYLALEMEHTFNVSGTLEQWQRDVGAHAEGNSRLTFAVACAFAAPLLHRLDQESGGFHFFGQSSKGKTTCVEVAGSVWGGPTYRETWRATANGLEAVALGHNDALLIVDEQGQALPKEAGEVAYLLAAGMDKVRAKKTLDGRPRRRWRSLFLSTGEITLSDKMREDGRASKAGQEVRLVDIPINPDGIDQAFERWDGFGSSQALANHLRSATRRTYGTSSRAFLERLCRITPEELLALEKDVVTWAKSHTPKGADSQVLRVVDRFALVATTGEMAQQWGIAPWTPGNSSWAAEACLKAWLTQRGGIGAGEHERGILAVLGFIERHGTSRFSDWAVPGDRVVNCSGCRRRDGLDRIDYLFNSEGWKDACEGLNPREVARACADAGLLTSVMESGRLRFQKNVKVPGRGTERFYIITGQGLETFRARQAELDLCG